MKELPIFASRDEFLEAISSNQVVIVVGETGSGKTTQLPIFLYEGGFSNGKKIGITEPRRIAAISVADFVAESIGTELGDVIGYQIRFDDTTADSTKVKFMTDGILLREIQEDPNLSHYSVIMVDEAHERSQNIDFVLGLLKDLLKRREDLKVVVASATIDQEKFSRYFWNAPIVSVPGRMFDVDIVWSKSDIPHSGYDFAERKRTFPIVDAVVQTVSEIHTSQPDGDVLVFMTGEDDIKRTVEGLEKLKLTGVVILPAYGSLPPEEQARIFHEYPGRRKIVVATNVAETSITIDGVVYVVDSGFIKQTDFNPASGIGSLEVVEHSKSGCNQRAGRAGRTRPGVCYRMYTQENYERRAEYTKPEILRESLAGVVLAMESIGINNVQGFDFIDPPNASAFREAYDTLIALGAIEKGKKGLLKIGVAMARLPLEPRISRMVLEAQKYGCVDEIVTIAAFLSVRSPFARPKDKEREADEAHHAFSAEGSDLLAYIHVWGDYEVYDHSMAWCYDNFLNKKSLDEAGKIRDQLIQILESNGIEITTSDSYEDIMKAVASGLMLNLLSHTERYYYTGVMRSCYGVCIHPSSVLFGRELPRMFVAANIVATTKTYARGCSIVKLAWLPGIAPHIASFGEIKKIVSVLPDGAGAVVKRDVFFRGNILGEAEVEVPLTEAKEFYAKEVRKAQESGMIRLVFSRGNDDLSWDNLFGRLTAKSGGITYVASSLRSSVKEGVTYWCKKDIEIDRKVFVYTELEVLPELEDHGADGPEVETNSSVPGIGDLLAKFGERITAKVTGRR